MKAIFLTYQLGADIILSPESFNDLISSSRIIARKVLGQFHLLRGIPNCNTSSSDSRSIKTLSQARMMPLHDAKERTCPRVTD